MTENATEAAGAARQGALATGDGQATGDATVPAGAAGQNGQKGQAGHKAGGTGEQPTVAVRPSPRPKDAPPRPSPRPAPRPGPPQPQAPARPAPDPTAIEERSVDPDAPTVRTSAGEPAGGEQPAARTPEPATADATTAVRTAAPSRVTVALAAPQTPWFASSDAEQTRVLPRSPAAPAPMPSVDDGTTQRFAMAGSAVPPPLGPGGPAEGGTAGRRPRRRGLLVVTGLLVALVLLYVGDLVLGSGSIPRGVTVGGVAVGGMRLDAAEQRLRAEIEPRTKGPIPVTVGQARGEIDPAAAGLAVDWAATLQRAAEQPLNPVTRVTSFFSQREVEVVTAADPQALDAALQELSPVVDRAPVEGNVRFEGVRPLPVDPVPGQRLDVPAAAQVLQREWTSGRDVALPLTVLPPATTPEDVSAAIENVARPAVSAPITVIGEKGVRGTISPEVIASALLFRADGDALVPELGQAAIEKALDPQMAPSEQPGRDATIDFSSGKPVIVPSQDGRGVDYPATLTNLLNVLTSTGPREVTAVYGDQPAELTTEELRGLGITGVIGEFTTGGFAPDSGQNIKRAAEQINGKVVKPGETFSLNGATGQRNAANGYVEAGIINDGHPSRGIGGGVSQLATTLYNAAYFAGMVDVEHKPHSFYISRYPAGREATVYEGAIDLKFRNDNPTGVMIQTIWTPSSLTVRLYGTKRYEVTSTPGPRTNPTQPNTVTIPDGEPCSPSRGAPGFTITDTRTLREISTGQVRTEHRTTRYNPSPIVVCGD